MSLKSDFPCKYFTFTDGFNVLQRCGSREDSVCLFVCWSTTLVQTGTNFGTDIHGMTYSSAVVRLRFQLVQIWFINDLICKTSGIPMNERLSLGVCGGKHE